MGVIKMGFVSRSLKRRCYGNQFWSKLAPLGSFFAFAFHNGFGRSETPVGVLTPPTIPLHRTLINFDPLSGGEFVYQSALSLTRSKIEDGRRQHVTGGLMQVTTGSMTHAKAGDAGHQVKAKAGVA